MSNNVKILIRFRKLDVKAASPILCTSCQRAGATHKVFVESPLTYHPQVLAYLCNECGMEVDNQVPSRRPPKEEGKLRRFIEVNPPVQAPEERMRKILEERARKYIEQKIERIFFASIYGVEQEKP